MSTPVMPHNGAVPAAKSIGRVSSISPKLYNLNDIARDALTSMPPRTLLFSILGRPSSWMPDRAHYSEYGIIDVRRMGRTLRYLADLTIPSVPRKPPSIGLPLINRMFWRPSVILHRPDHTQSYTSYPDEAWFFVNGVATNDWVAQLNSAYLSYLFHRPLTMIQNATVSLALDLIECIVDKESYRYTEAATKAFPPIYDALRRKDKRRVVVIAHSQGTIIMATVLKMLDAVIKKTAEERRSEVRGLFGPEAPLYAPPEFVYPDQAPWDVKDFIPLDEQDLAKLEVYCFANCATTMKHIRAGDQPIPWIENFGNEFDLVAWLGMLAPKPAERGISIDGPCYVRPKAWGHFLNAHYLRDIEVRQKMGRKRGCANSSAPYVLANAEAYPACDVPRLFQYINGGEPSDEG